MPVSRSALERLVRLGQHLLDQQLHQRGLHPDAQAHRVERVAPLADHLRQGTAQRVPDDADRASVGDLSGGAPQTSEAAKPIATNQEWKAARPAQETVPEEAVGGAGVAAPALRQQERTLDHRHALAAEAA